MSVSVEISRSGKTLHSFKNNSASVISQNYLLRTCPIGSRDLYYTRYYESLAPETSQGLRDIFIHSSGDADQQLIYEFAISISAHTEVRLYPMPRILIPLLSKLDYNCLNIFLGPTATPEVSSAGIEYGNASIVTFKRVPNAISYTVSSGDINTTLSGFTIDSSDNFWVSIIFHHYAHSVYLWRVESCDILSTLKKH